MNELYVHASNSTNIQQANSQYLKLAQAGHNGSQIKIAEAYMYGKLGCKKDYNQAIHWFTQAYENGNKTEKYHAEMSLNYIKNIIKEEQNNERRNKIQSNILKNKNKVNLWQRYQDNKDEKFITKYQYNEKDRYNELMSYKVNDLKTILKDELHSTTLTGKKNELIQRIIRLEKQMILLKDLKHEIHTKKEEEESYEEISIEEESSSSTIPTLSQQHNATTSSFEYTLDQWRKDSKKFKI